jgi:hypothetical protein
MGQVSIPNSPWVVLTEVYACSAIDGSTKIVAENRETHERRDLVVFGGEFEADVTLRDDNEIVVTTTNLVDIESKVDNFGKYRILFEFMPKDDPEERKNYQFWAHHPDDPRAQEWYHKWMDKYLYH